jgi:hypothetical protein
MIKFNINKDKVFPDIIEYIKILVSSIITYYIFKPVVLYIYPRLGIINGVVELTVWIIITVYFRNLIDIKINGHDYF